MKERKHINLIGTSGPSKGSKSIKRSRKNKPAAVKGKGPRQLAKKLANRFSTSVGNPWHKTKIDTRRKLNTDKSKKGKRR